MAEDAETADDVADKPRKRSKLPLIVGLVLMLGLGGGGFFAARSGMIPGLGGKGDAQHAAGAEEAEVEPLPDIAFVPLEPIIISLSGDDGRRHLRFTAQLEVNKAYEAEVQLLVPRVLDMLNGYLRAVDARTLEDAAALVRLRAQIIRRVQLVTGEGRVRDVLLTEFVIN
jgi:flagellar FliL protein